jgi:hypothetical protein
MSPAPYTQQTAGKVYKMSLANAPLTRALKATSAAACLGGVLNRMKATYRLSRTKYFSVDSRMRARAISTRGMVPRCWGSCQRHTKAAR